MNNSEKIKIANIATFPDRRGLFKKTCESIIDQVDVLNIYLNNYEEVPEFLKQEKINVVLSKDAIGDLKDNGKFYFLDKCPEDAYYFTIDDDIEYPKDYVLKMTEFLNSHNDNVVVGEEGRIFHCNFESFCRTRTSFYFGHALSDDMVVSALGTGTLAFKKDLLRNLSIENFKTTGMADLWLAAFCKENKIPLLCMQREESWLKNIHEDDSQVYSLWNESLKNEDLQNELIKKYKLWELNLEGERRFRAYLENMPPQIVFKNETDCNIYKKNINFLEKEINSLKESKSFLLGNLFFRSIKSPRKWITFPYNLVRILIGKKQEVLQIQPVNIVNELSNTMQYCSICEKKSKFLDFGDPLRKSVQCPSCNSLERHRFLKYIYEVAFLNSKRNINLLHMAPEKCIYDILKNKTNIKYIAVDLFPENFPFVECFKEDFINLSFADKFFDVILSNHVMEHIQDDAKFLSEMRRCLSDDGCIVLSIPMKKEMLKTYEDEKIKTNMERKVAFGQEDHVRIYGRDVYDRLEGAGFIVNQFDAGIFSEEFIKENSLLSEANFLDISGAYFILRKKLS